MPLTHREPHFYLILTFFMPISINTVPPSFRSDGNQADASPGDAVNAQITETGLYSMIHRILPVILPLLISAAIFAQDKKENSTEKISAEIANLPSQSFNTHIFDVEKFSISLGYDSFGRGEILNVEFGLRNKTDDDRELYIYTIATEEIDTSIHSSFNRPVEAEDKSIFLNFVTFPIAAEDANKDYRHMKNTNFRYSDGKNNEGPGILQKFPRDPKLGVAPHTGKAYELKDTLYVKTNHMSRYRKNYVFFNHVTLLIFDAKNLTDEKGALNRPLYRQIYKIEGIRK